ncbi:MAG: hypothetical protein M1819_002113 [Sarea resinae]|nr:MAG: hypothetical protein M1819_002113 [Sarea resinae]
MARNVLDAMKAVALKHSFKESMKMVNTAAILRLRKGRGRGANMIAVGQISADWTAVATAVKAKNRTLTVIDITDAELAKFNGYIDGHSILRKAEPGYNRRRIFLTQEIEPAATTEHQDSPEVADDHESDHKADLPEAGTLNIGTVQKSEDTETLDKKKEIPKDCRCSKIVTTEFKTNITSKKEVSTTTAMAYVDQ